MNQYMPVHVYTGEYAVSKNEIEFSRYGKRCALITGKSSAVKSGALQDVTDTLTRMGVVSCVYDGISQNPSVESCISGGRFANQFRADYIIGIGGGPPWMRQRPRQYSRPIRSWMRLGFIRSCGRQIRFPFFWLGQPPVRAVKLQRSLSSRTAAGKNTVYTTTGSLPARPSGTRDIRCHCLLR